MICCTRCDFLEVDEDVYCFGDESFCHDCYRECLAYYQNEKTKEGYSVIDICNLKISLKYMNPEENSALYFFRHKTNLEIIPSEVCEETQIEIFSRDVFFYTSCNCHDCKRRGILNDVPF